ncbi:response regulator transcription factor [Paenibacillus bouchesdurhonensis]|uniref:response regulator transcription factor n=1 Tax=Paenibacillus bouchesdurhonensis TaxID=1870990 RepID=UPI000DA610C7|nr:response regulator transcription factor [Paenibacillus bouchesdurhonensis]
MYTVMIVDDEPKLRLGLQTLIPWQELGYEIMGTAANGNEALRVDEEQIPDVILVDIRMPGMDGLQLLQEIRRRGWDTHAIVLSGYADFEYARQALQYGVEGYLLKPVNKEELSALLQKLHQQISADRLEKQVHQDAKSPEWAVYSLLSGSHDLANVSIDNLAKSLGMDWPKYQIVLISFPGLHPEEDERIRSFRERLVTAYAADGQSLVLYFAPYTVLLLANTLVGDFGRADLYRELQMLSGEIRTHMDVAAGETVLALDQITNSFRTARSLLERSFFYDKGRVLTLETPESYRQAPSSSKDTSLLDGEEVSFRLYYLVDVGHAEGIHSLLDEVAAQMAIIGKGETEIRERFFYLANETLRKVSPRLWSESIYPGEPAQFLAGIYSQRFIRDLVGYVTAVMERLARCADYTSRDNEMRRLLDFIERHYYENLRLEMLAGLFNYSSSYLGQLFKSHTGEYFNAYLDRVRIDKAKELLTQGLKVYEVAEKVGYSNVNYFHNKFKKLEGQSPSSYQKKS